jgi:lipocalin
LWILARAPVPDAAIISARVEKAKALGFETEKLIYVKQLK